MLYMRAEQKRSILYIYTNTVADEGKDGQNGVGLLISPVHWHWLWGQPGDGPERTSVQC